MSVSFLVPPKGVPPSALPLPARPSPPLHLSPRHHAIISGSDECARGDRPRGLAGTSICKGEWSGWCATAHGWCGQQSRMATRMKRCRALWRARCGTCFRAFFLFFLWDSQRNARFKKVCLERGAKWQTSTRLAQEIAQGDATTTTTTTLTQTPLHSSFPF